MLRKWTDEQRAAHDELSKYSEYQKDMQFYADRLDQIETDYARVNQRLDGDMVKTWDDTAGAYKLVYQGAIQRTPNPGRTTTKIASYLDQKSDLDRRYHDAEQACIRLERELMQRLAGYGDQHRCLSYYYLSRLSLSDVAEVMNYSLSKVKDLRKEGLTIYSGGHLCK